MNKKLILLILRILCVVTTVVSLGFTAYFWHLAMPMKSVLCAMGGAMIVFNLIVSIFLIKKNMK
ncbi:MAG: hypothetical protein Q4F97_05135 [Bacteroidales bacterium]|nr:hypothetical protein [Bacteroidales bacterium]